VDLTTLAAQRRPGVWPDFERGHIDEARFAARYWRDGRPLDVLALKEALAGAYAWIDGIEAILEDLRTSDVEMHVMSNYPVWYRRIEARLGVSRYLPWTFVSCNTGRRKPDSDAYAHVAATLDVAPERLILVDDRETNCAGARAAGSKAIRFTTAPDLRSELERRI
jgi:HAD superfamily hydrolase (TIGR01509 family)